MSNNDPLAALRGIYQGPRAAEWVLGFATSGLLASDLTARISTEGVQTAYRYYFQSPLVGALQTTGTAIDIAIIALVAGWMGWPRYKTFFSLSLRFVACLGAPVVWLELIHALSVLKNGVFLLPELPLRPVNNYGLVGSTVFLLYVVSTLRIGKRVRWEVLVKLLLGIVVAVGQLWAYSAMEAKIHL